MENNTSILINKDVLTNVLPHLSKGEIIVYLYLLSLGDDNTSFDNNNIANGLKMSLNYVRNITAKLKKKNLVVVESTFKLKQIILDEIIEEKIVNNIEPSPIKNEVVKVSCVNVVEEIEMIIDDPLECTDINNYNDIGNVEDEIISSVNINDNDIKSNTNFIIDDEIKKYVRDVKHNNKIVHELHEIDETCSWIDKEQKIPVTISIGISLFRKDDDCFTVFERADTALYLAKKSGRNNVKTEDDVSGN